MFDPATSAPILSAQDLEVTYGHSPILHSIQLSLLQGEWISVIGPNGSGKSTSDHTPWGSVPQILRESKALSLNPAPLSRARDDVDPARSETDLASLGSGVICTRVG